MFDPPISSFYAVRRSVRHPQTQCLTTSNSVFDNLKHAL